MRSHFFLITISSLIFAACSHQKAGAPNRSIAAKQEAVGYVTHKQDFWAKSKDYTPNELSHLNDLIRRSFDLTIFETKLQGKTSIVENGLPRITDCEITIWDFSHDQTPAEKIIVQMKVLDSRKRWLEDHFFSTAEDLKEIKDISSRGGKVLLYRPYGSSNLTVEMRMDKNLDTGFVNIVTNTSITFDKKGTTCEFEVD